MTPIPFSESDKMNPLWQKFMDHFESRLNELRVLNDRETSEVKTAETRGRIAEMKAWIGKGKPVPVID